jgi:3-methyl-2-oxobutanoate hydroxymethyltransferase
MVKLEGGGWTVETVRFLVERGIPVFAHLGLRSQSVNAVGGYRVQGRDEAGAQALERQAWELTEAGAALLVLVLELVPAALARRVQEQNPGLIVMSQARCSCCTTCWASRRRASCRASCATSWKRGGSIGEALRRYVRAVKDGGFPAAELHTY